MNYLTVFFHYFSDQRFSEILEHFGVTKEKKKNRLELINQLLDSKNFRDTLLPEFLFKAELQNFCKSTGINSSGNKKQIWNRITLFLRDIEDDSISITRNEQYIEVTFVVDSLEHSFRDSSEMFKFNALAVVHRLVDYWKYNKNEDKAIKALRSLHPELTLDICSEMFTYSLTAYKEAMEIVEANTAIMYKNLDKLGTKKWEIQPFEEAFLKKYKKLNKNQLWIFEQIFFWHHLK
jgi:hypothetical protein